LARYISAGQQLLNGALPTPQELIPAEAPQGVAFPHQSAQALAHQLQHLIACRVAVQIVDVLEAVQVEKKQGGMFLLARHSRHRLIDPVKQQPAAGQPGSP